jgi:hypothetical protein
LFGFGQYVILRASASGSVSERERARTMVPGISKDQLWHKIERLDRIQQETVVAFIDSLLESHTLGKPDKDRLLTLSVWTEEEVQQIIDAQGLRFVIS